MKIEISSFFDGYEEDTSMTESTQCSKERIMELTMKKINANITIKMKKPVRIALIAAAVFLLLSGTVFAAVMSGIRFTKNNGAVQYDSNGEIISYDDAGALIDVTKVDGIDSTLVVMKPGYQPEMNEASIEQTVFHLQDDDSRYEVYLTLLAAELGTSDLDAVFAYDESLTAAWEEQYKEENGVNYIPDNAYTDRYEKLIHSDEIDAFLNSYGILDEKYSDALTHIYRSDGANGWGADIQKVIDTDIQFILEGDTDLVKESELRGMSAMYITNHYVSDEFSYDMNVIALRDDATGILFTVYGSYGFDELEKIANGMELIDTGMPCITSTDSFGGLLAAMAQG